MRVRWNMNTDTPLPPDEPAGENPPDGAVIDYYLGSATSAPVTLEIQDAAGQLVRRYSSSDPVPPIDPMLAVPTYWVRPAKGLPGEPGMHRFLWDMHYAPIPGLKPAYPIAAVYRNTAPEPTSPWVMPGKYSVVLTVNGKSYTQPLIVQMDPRVKTTTDGLTEQFKLSKQLYDHWLTFAAITDQTKALRSQLADVRSHATAEGLKAHIDSFSQKLDALVGAENPRPDPAAKLSIQSASGRLRTLFAIIQDVDSAPTPQATAAVVELRNDAQMIITGWEAITSTDISALNQKLTAARLAPINLTVPK